MTLTVLNKFRTVELAFRHVLDIVNSWPQLSTAGDYVHSLFARTCSECVFLKLFPIVRSLVRLRGKQRFKKTSFRGCSCIAPHVEQGEREAFIISLNIRCCLQSNASIPLDIVTQAGRQGKAIWHREKKCWQQVKRRRCCSGRSILCRLQISHAFLQAHEFVSWTCIPKRHRRGSFFRLAKFRSTPQVHRMSAAENVGRRYHESACAEDSHRPLVFSIPLAKHRVNGTHWVRLTELKRLTRLTTMSEGCSEINSKPLCRSRESYVSGLA